MHSIPVSKTHFILYVKDQARSTAFYSQVLGAEPSLNVPGMTEFTLSENTVLGLMPVSSINRLIGSKLPEPIQETDAPRSELYLLVRDPLRYHQRAVEAGAIELSGLESRDWEHRVAYSLDPDGHVLAFAEEIETKSVQE